MNLKTIMPLALGMLLGITTVDAGKRPLSGNFERAAKKIKFDSDSDSESNNNNNNAQDIQILRKQFKHNPFMLHIACRLIKRLKDDQITAEDATGKTLLHHAACGQSTDPVSLLITRGACVNAQDGRNQTSLHHACQIGHFPVIQALLLGGASCKYEDMYGNKPLHYAVQTKNAEIVRLLVASGANVHDIHCPLVEALKYRAYSVVPILLEAGASPEPYVENCPRPFRTLLEATKNLAWYGQSQEYLQALAALKALIIHGANILLTNGQDFEPVPYALDSGNSEIAQAILLESFIPHCRYDEQIHVSYTIPSWVQMSHLIAQKKHAKFLQERAFNEKFVKFINGHVERHLLILKKLIHDPKVLKAVQGSTLADAIIKPLQEATAFNQLPEDFSTQNTTKHAATVSCATYLK